MKFLVHLRWKVLLPLDQGFDPGSSNSDFFNLSGGKGFVRSLGGDFRLDDPPVVLSPTDLFHDALKKTREALGLEGTRFPYRYTSPSLQSPLTANFKLHCHARFLCVTAHLDPFFVTNEIDWANLQDLRSDSILWPLTTKVLALALTGSRTKALSNQPQVFPAIHIKALEQDLPDWDSQMVSLVTRHADVNSEIVEQVLTKNQAHQVDRTLVLVDKQGIAAYVPSNTGSAAVFANFERFEHSTAMLQLAAVLRLKKRNRAAIANTEIEAIVNPTAAIVASVSGRRIWDLLVREFSLSMGLKPSGLATSTNLQPLDQAPSASSHLVPMLFRVLLFTVTPVETQALVRALTDATGRKSVIEKVDGFSYQNFGKLGDYEVLLQISGMGSGGINGSQESVRRSIQAVHPNAVMMVGIAFGVDREKQPAGTILVSQQIQTYELQRINKDASISPRGDKATASPLLLNWVSHAEINWPESRPKIKQGLVLSGEKLVDNLDFRNQLLKVEPDALGGEMEGAGLCVASNIAKVEWLLVKAVCDWADGNKATDKDALQTLAAQTAAEFTIHMLRENSKDR